MNWKENRGFFVTGTDTEVGKTLVTALVLDLLKSQYERVLAFKPVVAGLSMIEGSMQNEDLIVLQRMATKKIALENICPYILADPAAPHLVAETSGIDIDDSVIMEHYHAVRRQSDFIVVEGVGGFFVPLSESYDTAKFAQNIDLPVILVVAMRLGCLSHALLSIEAILAKGLSIAGWVANCIDPKMDYLEGNIKTLNRLIEAPCLGTLPYNQNIETPYSDADISSMKGSLDLSMIK